MAPKHTYGIKTHLQHQSISALILIYFIVPDVQANNVTGYFQNAVDVGEYKYQRLGTYTTGYSIQHITDRYAVDCCTEDVWSSMYIVQ